jgi:hypothetical protein
MFLPNSRYSKVPTVVTSTVDGREVTALKLRPLPSPVGERHSVKDNDQLDALAHEQYGDGTRFWHLADANTALQANDLVAHAGNVISKPKS